MKIVFQIHYKDLAIPSQKEMKRWIETALFPKKQAQVTVRMVDIKEIKSLNQSFRQKNKITDILSFPFEAPFGFETDLLGDIVICPQKIILDAKKQHKKIKHHFAHLLIHGSLHLLGFDHKSEKDARVMMAKEIRLLKKFNIPNPYLE